MAESPRHADVQFEKTDIRGTPVLRFVIALGFAIAAVVGLLLFLYRGLASYLASLQPPPPIMQFEADRRPPLPRLQAHPADDLAKVRAEEKATLESYGWVDRDAGVVRIPISEAMKLIAARGLPEPSPAKPAEVNKK